MGSDFVHLLPLDRALVYKFRLKTVSDTIDYYSLAPPQKAEKLPLPLGRCGLLKYLLKRMHTWMCVCGHVIHVYVCGHYTNFGTLREMFLFIILPCTVRSFQAKSARRAEIWCFFFAVSVKIFKNLLGTSLVMHMSREILILFCYFLFYPPQPKIWMHPSEVKLSSISTFRKEINIAENIHNFNLLDMVATWPCKKMSILLQKNEDPRHIKLWTLDAVDMGVNNWV